MFSIKEFSILNGLEGNSTNGWYFYLNVNQYTITFNIVLETDTPTPTSRWNLGMDILWIEDYIFTCTQEMINFETNGNIVNITATYNLTKTALENAGGWLNVIHEIADLNLTVTDSTTNESHNMIIKVPAYSTNVSIYCNSIKSYSVEYINNKIKKCLTGKNIYLELELLFDPTQWSLNDLHLNIFEYDSLEMEMSNLSVYLDNITILETKQSGWIKISGLLYKNSDDTLFSLTYMYEIGCYASGLADFSDNAYTYDEHFEIWPSHVWGFDDLIAYGSISPDSANIYINPTNNHISLGPSRSVVNSGALLSDTSALHVYGNLIATNVVDLINRLSIIETTKNTIASIFSETGTQVGSVSFATTTASTLQYTGLEVNLKKGCIYAIYCGSSAAGSINKVSLYTKNSSGSWYNHFTYDINGGSTATSMDTLLPIFYCQSNITARLYVNRTSTSTTKNTYKIYKLVGPLLD